MQEHQINLPSGENGIDLLVSVSVLALREVLISNLLQRRVILPYIEVRRIE